MSNNWRKVEMSKFAKSVIWAACTALLIGTSTASAMTLRMATSNNDESIQGRFALKLAELIDENTGGGVTVQIFCCGQMGDAQERVEGAHLGQIDMGIGDFANLAQFLPELNVFGLPYLYRDVDHAIRAADPEYSEIAADLYEQLEGSSNLTILGSFYYGDRHLTTSSVPVRTPQDVAGLKIRTVPAEIFVETIAGLGAIPTPISFSEVPVALATGVVDGQENPFSTILASGLYESQRYLSLTGHFTSTLALYINKDSFSNLSEEHQDAVRDALKESTEYIRDVTDSEDAVLLARLKDEGVTVIGPDEGLDLEAFRTAVRAHINSKFPQFEDLITRVQAVQ